MRRALVAAFFAASIAAPAMAQDFNLRPTLGTLELVTNFRPDPRSIEVTAGGNINSGAAFHFRNPAAQFAAQVN